MMVGKGMAVGGAKSEVVAEVAEAATAAAAAGSGRDLHLAAD